MPRSSLVLLLVAALVGCQREPEAPPPRADTPQQPTRVHAATFFYPTDDLRLARETREVELPEIETFAIAALADEVLREMSIRWPGGFVPENTSVRAAYRLDDSAVIDLDIPATPEGWSTGSKAEILAVQSLVHTIVSNFRNVERVQILINGSEAPTFAGHVDLSKPLLPDRSLVAVRSAASPAPPGSSGTENDGKP